MDFVISQFGELLRTDDFLEDWKYDESDKEPVGLETLQLNALYCCIFNLKIFLSRNY